MKIEKIFSNHKCDKCKEKATHGVGIGNIYHTVCETCMSKLKRQDAIDELFNYSQGGK